MGQRSLKEGTKQIGLVKKPINPKSKGYDNLGRGSLKDLAKAHGNEGLEWARGCRGNETG